MKHALVGLFLLACATVASADDSASKLQLIYGAEIRAAHASADRKDNIELARKMLAQVEAVKDSPRFQVALCEQAYELTVRFREGYAVAIEAMQTAEKLEAADKAKSNANLLMVLRRAYTADRSTFGDAYFRRLMLRANDFRDAGKWNDAIRHVRMSLAVAKPRSPQQRMAQFQLAHFQYLKSLAPLHQQLMDAAHADDASAQAVQDLAEFQLGKLGDIDAALQTSAKVELPNRGLTAMFNRLRQRPGNLTQREQLAVSRWLEQLAADTQTGSASSLYARAAVHYEAFLEQHEADDVDKLMATKRLENARKRAEFANIDALLRSDVPIADAAAEGDGITIIALIDSKTELVLEPSGMHWRSLGAGWKPGHVGDVKVATIVIAEGKRAEWNPVWISPNQGRAVDKSNRFDVKLGKVSYKVKLVAAMGSPKTKPEEIKDKVEGKHAISIKTTVDGRQQVITIPDTAAGARWYKFRLLRD